MICIWISHLILGASVADLSVDGFNQNWEILIDWLPEEIIWRIEGIPTTSINVGPDYRMGLRMEGNNYSVSKMYKNLTQNEDMVATDDWKKIWKLKVMERIQYFVWKMQHDGLLTNQKKARMGLGSAICGRFGNVEEDIMHVLQDYLSAIKLGNVVLLSNNGLLFFFLQGIGWTGSTLI